MIWIDDREGSKELADLVTDGILTRLDCGDVMFMGYGPKGEVEIGMEYKKVGDLVNSIATGRLSGQQIPTMMGKYYKSYLIVEGMWRGNHRDGEVEVMMGSRWKTLNTGRRKFTYKGIWAYLCTMENMTGIIIKTTTDKTETVALIEAIYGWWQKPWKSHSAHLQMHKVGPPTAFMTVEKPSLVRRIAAELPSVGWGRSLEVEKKFESVEEMCMASEEEWMEIEGIGRATAKQVWEALR